ncbi:MAG: hypothetical protein ACE14T_06500, partial [Syntrophales bacterium]
MSTDFGIDFSGGISLQIQFKQATTVDKNKGRAEGNQPREQRYSAGRFEGKSRIPAE